MFRSPLWFVIVRFDVDKPSLFPDKDYSSSNPNHFGHVIMTGAFYVHSAQHAFVQIQG